MGSIAFKIVSPERVVFEARISQVSLPTEMGEITVLPNHIPVVSNLMPGEIVIQDEKGVETSLAVSGGFVQISGDAVTVLADTAVLAHEISEERAAEAHRRAHELLKAKAGAPDQDYARLKVLMDKQFARLKVARKYKQRGARSGMS